MQKGKISVLLLVSLIFLTWQVGGQEADSSDHGHSIGEMMKAGRPTVAPGFFMFPIAPGKPGFLAGSMGELRPNHFHGGLDIKTGGGVNQPVYAAADGYVSRLKQSPLGCVI